MTLSPTALRVLKSVASVPFLHVADIAAAVRLSESAVQTAAIELEQRGYVRLGGPPNANAEGDRGFDVDRVTITAKGVALPR